MANKLYPKGREAFLRGLVAWDADTIKVLAVTAAYAQNDAHDFLDDVAAGRVVTSAALGSKTYTDGVADAADLTYSLVAAGSTIVGLVIFKDTGVEATSRLLAWIDTKSDGTPISVATNGGDVVVSWPNDANRIFKL